MLTEEQRNFLIDTYKDYLTGKDTSKIARNTLDRFLDKFGFTVTNSTLHTLLKKEEIPTVNHGGKRRGFTREEFIELYHLHEGDTKKLIEATNYKLSGLLEKCRESGLALKNLEEYQKKKKRSTKYSECY